MKAKPIKDFRQNYISQEDLVKRLGISQSTIANKLRLLNLTKKFKHY